MKPTKYPERYETHRVAGVCGYDYGFGKFCGERAGRELRCHNGCCIRPLCVPHYKATRDYLARYGDDMCIFCYQEPDPA
jgi:hypothetical protein